MPRTKSLEWQQHARCAGITRFTTYAPELRRSFCLGCPVLAICKRAGYTDAARPNRKRPNRKRPGDRSRELETFNCGHPRTQENSVGNGKHESGRPRFICRRCLRARRAAA